jgi:hypothetical protein
MVLVAVNGLAGCQVPECGACVEPTGVKWYCQYLEAGLAGLHADIGASIDR